MTTTPITIQVLLNGQPAMDAEPISVSFGTNVIIDIPLTFEIERNRKRADARVGGRTEAVVTTTAHCLQVRSPFNS